MKNKQEIKAKDLNINVNIDDKLYLNRWKPDNRSHLIIIDAAICENRCPGKDCTVFCPARVYEWREGRISVGYEGCLECGACRIACPNGNIWWSYPRGGYGVQFKLA
ncbi:4Fe-4S ferredoxin iron-sulfur binding domain protein [Desulfofarcimen acetoxidans DSM 771]|uniref:Ferredoxin-like protein n=1 Tax=Desulfofarcimen acetoxidans (strain ATCC 49208 / DSM 771 / KCTC 5769 / VKM B-1644 / 5575) TaxID=485916 RepID=C8VY95_DESAS|nr:4Fe-4S dicluster domain-containing protein [Desulfofarcimen acetoxidans]ACV62776.1 4Fe-4S ferredoxin iron-sulfur binding domain protein [Desulfofarcimen acetoxidans DSM 771]